MLRHSTSRRRQCTLLCTALIAVSLALLRPVLAASAAAFPSPFAAAALDADVVLAETTISSDGSAHLFSFPPGSTPPPHRTLDDVLAHAREAYAAGLLRVPKADGSGLADPAVDALPPVPNAWDPRNNSYWTRTCPSLLSVRDQGDCGADWAASVVSALSDRACMQSNGEVAPTLSIQDVLSCCGWSCGLGCSGGTALPAWNYAARFGVVTGGGFNSSGDSTCLPYSFPPCHTSDNGTARACDSYPGVTHTPVCSRSCQNGAQWEEDKVWSDEPYTLSPPTPPSDWTNTSLAIAADLFYFGPVSATVAVYQDFLIQNPGRVYWHERGDWIGALTVKIVGYGSALRPFWIVAVPWGTGWGTDGAGFMRFLRGRNECGVESAVLAAMWKRNATSSN